MVAVGPRSPGPWTATCHAHARRSRPPSQSSCRTKKRVSLYCRSPWSPSSQSSLCLTRRASARIDGPRRYGQHLRAATTCGKTRPPASIPGLLKRDELVTPLQIIAVAGGRRRSCCSRPTTIPGDTPAWAAALRMFALLNVRIDLIALHCAAEMSDSEAKRSACFSFSVSAPSHSTNTSFLPCSRMCPISWKNVTRGGRRSYSVGSIG